MFKIVHICITVIACIQFICWPWPYDSSHSTLYDMIFKVRHRGNTSSPSIHGLKKGTCWQLTTAHRVKDQEGIEQTRKQKGEITESTKAKEKHLYTIQSSCACRRWITGVKDKEKRVCGHPADRCGLMRSKTIGSHDTHTHQYWRVYQF